MPQANKPVSEILLYGPIYSWSAGSFIDSFNQSAEEYENLTVRVNTEGGEPTYGWGIVARITESIDNVRLKVDGMAYSFGAFLCCYFQEVEALDISDFLIHRAAYSEWFENDPRYFTAEIKDNLIAMNKKLEAAFRGKVDVKKFEALKGVKVKDIFSLETRIDVFLSAAEAKSIGLISKIIKITPTRQAKIETEMAAVAQATGHFKLDVWKPSKKVKTKAKANNNTGDEPEEIEDTNPTAMTLDELKTKHPELYAQAVATGKTDATAAAVTAEQERVASWMKFNTIDAEAVKKGIESGKPLSMTDIAEFTVKGLSANAVASVKRDAQGNVITEAPAATKNPEQVKKVEVFENEVMAHFGVKPVAKTEQKAA